MLASKHRREQTVSVKESIIEAGITLLESQGIAAITQPRVAGTAGVKQSHLTYYFPTRTDLLCAIAECWITRALDEFSARLNEIPTMPTLTEAMAETMNDGPHPRAIVGLIVAADAEPKIRDSLRALDPILRQHLQNILVRVGLPAGSDEALLLQATATGLAVRHQSCLTPESAADFRTGIRTLFRYLALATESKDADPAQRVTTPKEKSRPAPKRSAKTRSAKIS